MLDASLPSLLDEERPSKLGHAFGKVLELGHRLAGTYRYDRLQIVRVRGVPVVVLPSVANPTLLRTGACFASQIDSHLIRAGMTVLDMGTGSGVCALFAARHARRVVAVDIGSAAVRCARLNAMVNDLEERIDVRQGDLFAPLARERFDLVLFNPPFLLGTPEDERDAAWRSSDIPQRFAAGLGEHLTHGGAALLLLSSFGDACPVFEQELRANGFALQVHARKRFINETVTILRVSRPAVARA